jgi:hypothetical protein
MQQRCRITRRRACRLCRPRSRSETDDKGETIERSIPFMKGYTVFNAEQCEGLSEHFTAKPEAPALPLARRCDAADRFFARRSGAGEPVGSAHCRRAGSLAASRRLGAGRGKLV